MSIALAITLGASTLVSLGAASPLRLALGCIGVFCYAILAAVGFRSLADARTLRLFREDLGAEEVPS